MAGCSVHGAYTPITLLLTNNLMTDKETQSHSIVIQRCYLSNHEFLIQQFIKNKNKLKNTPLYSSSGQPQTAIYKEKTNKSACIFYSKNRYYELFSKAFAERQLRYIRCNQISTVWINPAICENFNGYSF